MIIVVELMVRDTVEKRRVEKKEKEEKKQELVGLIYPSPSRPYIILIFL